MWVTKGYQYFNQQLHAAKSKQLCISPIYTPSLAIELSSMMTSNHPRKPCFTAPVWVFFVCNSLREITLKTLSFLYSLFVVSLSVGWLCQDAGLRPLSLLLVVWARWPLLGLVVAGNSSWHRRGVPVLRTMSGMLAMGCTCSMADSMHMSNSRWLRTDASWSKLVVIHHHPGWLFVEFPFARA